MGLVLMGGRVNVISLWSYCFRLSTCWLLLLFTEWIWMLWSLFGVVCFLLLLWILLGLCVVVGNEGLWIVVGIWVGMGCVVLCVCFWCWNDVYVIFDACGYFQNWQNKKKSFIPEIDFFGGEWFLSIFFSNWIWVIVMWWEVHLTHFID